MKNKKFFYHGVLFMIVGIILVTMLGVWIGKNKSFLQIITIAMCGGLFIIAGVYNIVRSFFGRFSMAIKNCVSDKVYYQTIRFVPEEKFIFAYGAIKKRGFLQKFLLCINYAGNVECLIDSQTEFFVVLQQGGKIVILPYKPAKIEKKK